MSEAELHHLKMRLHSGARNKAARGELRRSLPVGLVHLPSGGIGLNPDDEVQGRIRLVFSTFGELGSAHAVVRYLRDTICRCLLGHCADHLPHGVRDDPTSESVLATLHNPAYAGAYVYGRSTRDPMRAKRGRPGTGVVDLPIDRWAVLLREHHPAYISWETFMANQARLEANHNAYAKGRWGAPRTGEALLQGLAICARCGARMHLHYSGRSGEYPVYLCSDGTIKRQASLCQHVRTQAVDDEIERAVFEAWPRISWPSRSPRWRRLSAKKPH